MTIEQIRRAHQAKPFRPFKLRTADGREYELRAQMDLVAPTPLDRRCTILAHNFDLNLSSSGLNRLGLQLIGHRRLGKGHAFVKRGKIFHTARKMKAKLQKMASMMTKTDTLTMSTAGTS